MNEIVSLKWYLGSFNPHRLPTISAPVHVHCTPTCLCVYLCIISMHRIFKIVSQHKRFSQPTSARCSFYVARTHKYKRRDDDDHDDRYNNIIV